MWHANLNRFARIFTLAVAAIFTVAATGQTVISGEVSDNDGGPIESAIVKLLDGSKMVGYAMSKADGSFEVKNKSVAETLTLVVERLSYEKYTEKIANKTSTHDIVLFPKANELREVTVKAPPVYLRGDTLTFRLDAFKGKGDISLKDAMKKIPGIEINDKGTIYYQGKAISNFYIEGLDLLDGKYNLATDNIPADYVQAVQVLNNHKDAKIDKDRLTDNVAINIKLEPWAKFKPMGTYEAAAGWSDDALYKLGGAGMMFNDNFQTILTAKINNITEFADDMVRVHSSVPGMNQSNLLEPTIGRLSASQPPIKSRRYRKPDDKLISLNLLNKLGKDTQLRTQASYTYSKSSYDYSMIERYYDGDNQVVIDQSQKSISSEHKPNFSLEYRLNSEKVDISERFEAKAAFYDASLPTWRSSEYISQSEIMKTFDIVNYFRAHWRKGIWSWAAYSNLSYNGGPEGLIDVRMNRGDDLSIIQNARTSLFNARQGVSANIRTLTTYLSLPIDVTVSSDRIKTRLTHPAIERAINRVTGEDVTVNLNPAYSYQHPRNVITFTASAGLKIQSYKYRNHGSVAAEQKATRLTVNPTAYTLWNINARSSLTFNLMFTHRLGDVIDMLTAPMATNYLGLRARSGVIGENKMLTGSFAYKFQMPIEMLFFNASVSHNRTETNLMTAQSVSDNIIGSYAIDHPAHGESSMLRASITKQVQSIRTKFSISSQYNFGRQETFQNDEVIPYRHSGFTLSPSINTTPIEWCEINYAVSLAKTFTRFTTVARSYLTQTHNGRINFFFNNKMNVGVSNDMSWHELAPGVTKFISILDASASYTYKSWRFGLQLNNLLNARHYAYTIFSGLNNFSYDYHLRGRELIFSVTFTK